MKSMTAMISQLCVWVYYFTFFGVTSLYAFRPITTTAPSKVPTNAFLGRRDCIASILTTIVALPQLSEAGESESIQSVLRGVVSLKPGTEAFSSASAALYVTAKPETTINAPKEIADMFAGRPPPVLTARFPILSGSEAFPFKFQLNESDITAEGSYQNANEENKANKYWWTNDNLVVSARFDTDGVASTRDPDDLVGRAFSFVAKGSDLIFRYDRDVEVQLQGRGIGGKFITTKKDK
jgi:hypothetical protein